MAERSLDQSASVLKDILSFCNDLSILLDETHALLKALFLAILNVVDPALSQDDMANVIAIGIKRLAEGQEVIEHVKATLIEIAVR